MKIRKGWSIAGWFAACALLCVHARPTRDGRNEMYIGNSRLFNTRSANGYRFEEDASASKLSKIVDKSLEEFEEESPSTMRAITTKTRSQPVLLPLILEPEAEMLPPGYKGVKPPGVSHMELTWQKPQANSDRYESTLSASMMDDDESTSDQDYDPHYAASKYATQIVRDERDSLVFKTGSKSDLKKQRKKAEYREASGARKSHSRNENRAMRDDKEDVARKKGTTYEAGNGRRKAHDAAGYRSVYHEDDFEKDDNRGRAGHFEGHGRYGEQRVAAGTRGKNDDSGSIDVKANERGSLRGRGTMEQLKVASRRVLR